MKKEITMVLAVTFLLSIALVSAGLFDGLSKITGRATSQPTNVSVSVTGASVVTMGPIDIGNSYSPVENTFTDITFYVIMSDPDGVADLDDSSVVAAFSNGGITREDTSCTLVGDIDSTSANYSCTIRMYYWDTAGSWNINVSGTDNGNSTLISNTSESFTYSELKAMVISPASLTWTAMSSGASDQKANDDPTIINNTGNYDGTIDVTGLNLLGETTPTDMIYAANFTSSGNDGTVCASGTSLVNGTATAISGSDSNPGNLSAGAGQEQLYYCIPEVPLVSSQTYSTSQGGAWTISF